MTTAPLETAALARHTGATIPIPVVSTLDFGSDADEFYRLHAAHPVIVRDCFPAGHPLMNLDLDAIESLMGNIPIHVYGAAAESFREVPAKAVFDGVRGIGEPYNVVDFYLAGTALGSMFEHDRSAARGEMAARRLIVFKHKDKLGNAPAHKLFEAVKVEPINGAKPARSYADYKDRITIDKAAIPSGVEIQKALDLH